MNTFSRISIVIFLIFGFTISGAQNFKEDFDTYFQKGDTIKQLEVLTQWEKADPQNPDLIINYFNYYFMKGRKEVIVTRMEKPKDESKIIQDRTLDNEGYLVSEVSFKKDIMQKAINKLNKGIELYPARLDIRLAKIYTLGEMEKWEEFTDEIIETIDYSNEIKNEWKWTDDATKKNSKELMLSNINDYQLKMYNTQDNELLMNMRKVAEAVLKYYPDDLQSLSHLAITYLLNSEFQTGIDYLLKAERIDSTDVVILGNIAQGYKLISEKEKAIEYFEKVIQHGDANTAAYAKQQIYILRQMDE